MGKENEVYDEVYQGAQEEYEGAVRDTAKPNATDEDFARAARLGRQFALIVALGALIGLGVISR